MESGAGFEGTVARLREAVDETYRGNAQPYVDLWARSRPVSLFGALGPRKTAPAEIERALHWVASRFSDPEMSTDLEVVDVGRDMAYTVGYEQGRVAVDGKPQTVKIRVTQIFRREGQEWRLVHRHGDFAPIDDSPGSATRSPERDDPSATQQARQDQPVVLIARFKGDVEELKRAYDKAHAGLKGQAGPPIGELRHHCAIGNGALYLVGVWRSRDHVRRRWESPAFEKTLLSYGFPSPKTADLTILDLHATDPAL